MLILFCCYRNTDSQITTVRLSFLVGITIIQLVHIFYCNAMLHCLCFSSAFSKLALQLHEMFMGISKTKLVMLSSYLMPNDSTTVKSLSMFLLWQSTTKHNYVVHVL